MLGGYSAVIYLANELFDLFPGEKMPESERRVCEELHDREARAELMRQLRDGEVIEL